AEGRRAVVVVSALDRFGRRLLERVRSREELDSLGVLIHSVREGEVNETMANFMAVLAHEESERISVRVSRAWAHLAERGWYKVSSRLPWGCRRRVATEEERRAGSPKTVIEPDPVTEPYVRETFERAARGESIRSISRWASQL